MELFIFPVIDSLEIQGETGETANGRKWNPRLALDPYGKTLGLRAGVATETSPVPSDGVA